MQAREYPFLDSDVPGIFDDLLEANLIDLPEMKRPEEAERKDDPKYCKYHRLVGHAIQDCFVFKDKVYAIGSPSNEDTLFEKEDSSSTDDCMSTITFTDEDLLLGSKPHNRPLFVAGYELEISIDELSNSRLMIQGFNQGGQRAVGIIRMQLTMEDMVSSALFHVIDAKTSYNMLLGRPWLHENAVVPSTWHQCFKYCRNGIVKKVLGDNKPFTEAESHFADAKCYIEDANKGKEILPSEEPKSCNNQDTRKNDSSTLEPESLKSLTLPLTQINMKQPSKPPLKGFVSSTQEEERGHEALAIDEKGFDPKAFKLLIKAGYDPKEKLSLGKLPPEATGKKLHGLNATQIMLKEKGHAIQDSRVGLGFTPPEPVRIAIKRVNSNYISEGFSSTEDHRREENLREFVFNRLGPDRKELHGIANRQSVFDRVLKAKAQTAIFTQVQSNDEDDKESIASSNYISNSVEENIAQTYHITLIEDGEVEEEDAEDAPTELEEGTKATIDELKEVNLGDTENPRPIYISATLTHGEEGTYIALLHEFKDVFSWSYKEMPGLDPKIAVHHLIIPVRKKNGQIRVCVDFRDLNSACPKDDFPLPIAELMIDATTGHEALSFMDGSSGYNQIRMAPADEELTTFRTPNGIYCYKVMPFGLKNADATYQRAMQRIFDDMLHKNVECYVDDLVRGIEIEQVKIDAILRMPEPRNIHELKILQGKLAYLRRFISHLAGRCQLFSRLMKKDVPFQWDEACDKAFRSIKSYLMKPPVLIALVPGRPLILYVAAQERSVGILLA
ncbi:UNVERIFIED_CONTAM: Transposon Tf2-12 polyprotein [Sesamum calycinum]|uniref:Transposon Tf2-12 polyprotein n=1 Tax=Sesamum calycinum TaxID=2727403 RepID=A0AAW2MPS9_9LAMI